MLKSISFNCLLQIRSTLVEFNDPVQYFLFSVCPLAFPDTRHVSKKCANLINNHTVCCSAIENYMSHLQNQSFITNLQALNCAASLGMKLQRENVTTNVYNLCHVSLKQFSVQGSLCLLS